MIEQTLQICAKDDKQANDAATRIAMRGMGTVKSIRKAVPATDGCTQKVTHIAVISVDENAQQKRMDARRAKVQAARDQAMKDRTAKLPAKDKAAGNTVVKGA